MGPEREVRYVDSGGHDIAYDVLGDGPLDIVGIFEWGSSLDLTWEHPVSQRFLRGLGGIGRLIRFDIRGTGLSARMDRLPPLEEWVEDIGSVMDEVGSERAALLGHGHAAQPCMLFAAIHPERTTALAMINGFARLRRAPDYPWGFPPDAEAAMLEHMRSHWGSGRVLAAFNPGMATGPRAGGWLGRVERSAASPRAAVRKQTSVFEIDVRAALPSIVSRRRSCCTAKVTPTPGSATGGTSPTTSRALDTSSCREPTTARSSPTCPARSSTPSKTSWSATGERSQATAA